MTYSPTVTCLWSPPIHPRVKPADCRCLPWEGAYAQLPHGRVRYWLIGPEDGKKVGASHRAYRVPVLILAIILNLPSSPGRSNPWRIYA